MVHIKPALANTISKEVDLNTTAEEIPAGEYHEFSDIPNDPPSQPIEGSQLPNSNDL